MARGLLGGETMAAVSRKSKIRAEAALSILSQPVDFTGWLRLDDLV